MARIRIVSLAPRNPLSVEERREYAKHITDNPLAGVALGSGVRKVRWARADGGKRGGYRVVHLFLPEYGVLYILAIYEKATKANLTATERREIRRLAKRLRAELKRSNP